MYGARKSESSRIKTAESGNSAVIPMNRSRLGIYTNKNAAYPQSLESLKVEVLKAGEIRTPKHKLPFYR